MTNFIFFKITLTEIMMPIFITKNDIYLRGGGSGGARGAMALPIKFSMMLFFL